MPDPHPSAGDDPQLQELATALARLRRSEARYEASFMQAPIGMAMVGLTGDSFGRILEVNQALVDLVGYPGEDAIGRSIQDYVHSDDLGVILAGAAAAAEGQLDQLDREIRLIRPDGSTLWVRVRSRPVDDEIGERYGIVHVTDITERRRYEDELARLALHDPLTGLANRRLLMDRLHHALAGIGRTGHHVGVIYLDFDHFKSINDTYGHDAGDRLLVEAATRLTSAVRTIDTPGRFGGDEFVLVCPDLKDPEACHAITDRLREAFAEPIDVGPDKVTLTMSGGIALTDDPDADPSRLLSAADEALYRAKHAGRDRFELADR